MIIGKEDMEDWALFSSLSCDDHFHSWSHIQEEYISSAKFSYDS